jgi:hypothetical protein
VGQLRAAVPAGGGPLSERVRAARAVAALLVALAVSPPVASGQGEPPSAELSEATIVERDAAAEVWVRLSRPARYQAELMDNPWRLVLDFEDTAYRWSVQPQPVEVDPVRALRGSQYRKGVARLVIELRRKVAYVVEQDGEGLRIVLPRPPGVAAAPPPSTAPPATVSPPRPAPELQAVPPGARVAPAPPPGPRPASREPQVYGIVVLNEQRHAYIFDPTIQQVRRYAVGDTVGNGVVETIGEWTVVLKTPAGRVELRVDEARPARPPARPR